MNAMDREVARLLRERHGIAWMETAIENVFADLRMQHKNGDVSMNDLVCAFVCVMMREKEFFRSEFKIGF